MAQPKRRLPLLQTAADSDEPQRPTWQWVGFGALAIIAVWVPLSALVGAVAARVLTRTSDPSALPRLALVATGAYWVELAAGALAGGYLVGRWGPASVGVRQAGLGGLAAAAALIVVTWASFGPNLGLLLLVLLAPPMAALGGRLGAGRRRRLD